MNGLERDEHILAHIVEYCDQISETIKYFGKDETKFGENFIYQNALAMCLMQIGELAGSLSEEYRNSHPQMPWRQIKALRNIIAHHYGSVDTKTAWEIAQEDIPELKDFCMKEINKNISVIEGEQTHEQT